MASLARSHVSFRRSGSSGLVWDDKILSRELNKLDHEQQQQQQQRKSTSTIEEYNNNLKEHHVGIAIQRSRSAGVARGHRTGIIFPTIDPPSPKFSACGFCGLFAKNSLRSTSRKRRSRKM